ncbi:hypothetical protein L7F22_046471 [Adiantum nelumboides]|nr:hypothetical protein [Adiantum nelumboides]
MLEGLDAEGRKLVIIIDPHLARNDDYFLYKEARTKDVFVKMPDDKSDYEGWCWSGSASWLDGFHPDLQNWWNSLYSLASKKLKANARNMHFWLDMNEPAIFNGPEITAPKDVKHHGNWEHRDVHNIYSVTYHAASTLAAKLRESPNQRPFTLARGMVARKLEARCDLDGRQSRHMGAPGGVHSHDACKQHWRVELYGSPVLRPQYLVNPQDANGFAVDDQYYIGDSGLLVKPAVQKDATKVDIYLGKTGHTAGVRAKGRLYLDDGQTYADEEGDYVWKEFEWREDSSALDGSATIVSKDVEGSSSAGTDVSASSRGSKDAFRKSITDVRVERVVVLGLDKAPRSIKTSEGPVDFTWKKGSSASSKAGGKASVLVIKDPKVKIVEDWTIHLNKLLLSRQMKFETKSGAGV